MQKITPFLWFDNQAEEAARFYCSIFKNSRINSITRNPTDGPVMFVSFSLDGEEYFALNGGPHFQFTPAISLFVNCESQAEVDNLWAKLTAGGEESMCGWLKDRYGLSWQIIPAGLTGYLYSPDAEKSQRAMNAMLQMHKIDLEKIRQAYEQG
jgi:predicted 3-demethylubiquinone-9 3-methyltransferase (glyoxalase superfamily)